MDWCWWLSRNCGQMHTAKSAKAYIWWMSERAHGCGSTLPRVWRWQLIDVHGRPRKVWHYDCVSVIINVEFIIPFQLVLLKEIASLVTHFGSHKIEIIYRSRFFVSDQILTQQQSLGSTWTLALKPDSVSTGYHGGPRSRSWCRRNRCGRIERGGDIIRA